MNSTSSFGRDSTFGPFQASRAAMPMGSFPRHFLPELLSARVVRTFPLACIRLRRRA
jgi:hypothetical protein